LRARGRHAHGLPESETGTYFAGGILIGSTLRSHAFPASIDPKP
jgi:hypothetical protein